MTTSSPTLIRQIRVLDPVTNTNTISDILLGSGIIQAIEPHLDNIAPKTKIIDGKNLIIGPGLMDLYSYSGEPGHEDRETLNSLIQSAIAGGFTRLAILPQTIPPIDNLATLSYLQQQAQSLPPSIKLDFWGNLTLKGEGQQMTELGELAAAGVIGFTDNQGIENLGLLRRILEYLKPIKKPIAMVAEFASLKGNGVMREGYSSINYGLPGNPTMTEATAVATILEMVAVTQTPVHLMRISTRRAVELIAWGKARGIPITASTTWMHLLLDTEAIASYHPSLRLDPPLGNPEDRLALIDGVSQGIIDAIAVDHHGYTYEEKTVPFAEAPPGAIGLQLALPLLWQELVEKGQLTELQLWKALSCYPRQCLGEKSTPLTPGQPAELIIFDPQKSWKVTPLTLKSLDSNTPWLGQEIKGQVIS
ncbi:dihydroorotase [Crocosphaera sp. UHCC 0190]|uniref:dihydroorotase n=1 Tax=Crocosphaera sp. UHCC 0190 TaxID=3110246 RepID=UPI002B210848|nr:dihydroorotase [Crocosphaera sp. UHCC 0190]MEA5511574.1 dihydroorotase [Crocosphaera sp. UHCC 0190]